MTDDRWTKIWDAYAGDPMDPKNNTEAGLRRVVKLLDGHPSPHTHVRPLELLDRADDEAIEWITSNLTAIRRDDGSLHYNLTQIVRAFQAGKERS